ncbi:hypothetical protein [Ruminococcus albus]|uniref:WD40-like Beta Propeller Repeat n=1 Tax=Ruminococcus albus TaxID=1264 RepID=A0A1I1NVJ4_RUMAL|nr:hypothetical protein [Ruminococcus albus]SFC99518.1 hypothetical protein SAMN02910406_02837 [Ruminococcus albus]
MEERLNKIAENMTEEQAEVFEDSFSDFGADSSISEEQTDRILSSFMRKAGFDMNETNSIISQNRDIKVEATGVTKVRSNARIQLKRSGAIAACIALLAAGGLVFSLKNNIKSANRENFSYSEKADKKSDDTGLQNLKKNVEQNTGMILKLRKAYPDCMVQRINDDRYLIYNHAVKNGGSVDARLMIYDVPSDSVINTINTEQYVLFDMQPENKIATYAFIIDDENKVREYLATIYDDSGNVLYEYDLDLNNIDHEPGRIGEQIMPYPSPDGKTLCFKYIWMESAGEYDNVQHSILYYVRYEDQKNIIKLAGDESNSVRPKISNDLLLLAYSDDDGINRAYLYSLSDMSSSYELKWLETLSEEKFEQPGRFSANGNSIIFIGEEDNKLNILKPDENGDIKVGDKCCSIFEYDLFDEVKDDKAFACVTQDGKYAAAACITEDNKMISTLYEINDDGINELKTIEKELEDTEFSCFAYDSFEDDVNLGFDSKKGVLTLIRVRPEEKDLYNNEGNCEVRTDTINFF